MNRTVADIRAEIRRGIKATDFKAPATNMKGGDFRVDAPMLYQPVVVDQPKPLPVSYEEELADQAESFEYTEKTAALRRTLIGSAIVITIAVLFVSWGWTAYFVQ